MYPLKLFFLARLLKSSGKLEFPEKGGSSQQGDQVPIIDISRPPDHGPVETNDGEKSESSQRSGSLTTEGLEHRDTLEAISTGISRGQASATV